MGGGRSLEQGEVYELVVTGVVLVYCSDLVRAYLSLSKEWNSES